MKMFISLLLLVFSASVFAAEVNYCHLAGKNGCPATFLAGTKGCVLCASCAYNGGENTWTPPFLNCWKGSRQILNMLVKLDVKGGLEMYSAPVQYSVPRELNLDTYSY